MSCLSNRIEQMYDHELRLGGRAAFQYALLKDVRERKLPIGDFEAVLFYNPGRVHSVMADVSPQTLATRRCFLCPDGLEDKQQTYLYGKEAQTDADAAAQPAAASQAQAADYDNTYAIRVNPFPIFAPHFTISSARHEPQQIKGHYLDMLRLVRDMPDYCIFYNGARCGASAPDHMHFQAVKTGNLPMQVYVDNHRRLPRFCPSARWIHGTDSLALEQELTALIDEFARKKQAPTIEQDQPPRPDDADFNMVSWWNGELNTIIQFRRQSRPACFFAADEAERILISPGAVEMCGVAIVTTQEMFDKLTADKLLQIIEEVSITI